MQRLGVADINTARPSGTQIRQEGSRFGDTNVTGGLSLQGNFAGATINSTARPEYVGQFSHSSVQPVKDFVPRPSLRDQITTQLWNDEQSDTTKILVVSGLGGAGKTQLVLDYIRHYRTNYRAIFWIQAGSKESLDRDIVNLYQTLNGQTVVAHDNLSVEKAVIGVKSWFSGRQGPWLMVFDSADTIDNEESREFIDIKHFIPDVASLHVAITTRSNTARDMTELEGVQVGEMEEAEAIELFYRYSKLPRNIQEVEIEVKAIVEELAYFALAVTLSGTYVGEIPRLRSNIKNYLPEYRQRQHALLNRRPKRLTHQYGESVLTTWETSYQAIKEECSKASTLMTILSFLSPDDIYLVLFGFDSGIDTVETTIWEDLDFGSSVSVYELEEWFGLLQRYSLVQWKQDQGSFLMHKLVHAWGYDRLTPEEQHTLGPVALKLVVRASMECGHAPQDKSRLLPHMMAVFSAIAGTKSQQSLYKVEEHTLVVLCAAGAFVESLGRFPETLAIFRFVYNERIKVLGQDHPGTLVAMNSLANALHDQAKLDEAAQLQKELLEKSRLILGEEHRDTISVMNNLANTLYSQDQLDEAVQMQEEVVEKRTRVLGADHSSTLSAMNNLASMLASKGQLEETAKTQKQVLETSRRTLGEEHPGTLRAEHNLAKTLCDQGLLNEASQMQKEVLEKRRHIFSEEHPDTIRAEHNLASTLYKQGQIEEAAQMQREVLERSRRVLGEEHPDTIRTARNLAITLRQQGQPDEVS